MALCVHQVWWQGWDAVPPRLYGQVQSVARAFGPLGVRIERWDGVRIERLVGELARRGAPGDAEIVRAFAGCQRVIEKCDIGRLAILHARGGLYLDLDVTASGGAAVLAQLRALDPRFAYGHAGSFVNARARRACRVLREWGWPCYSNSVLFAARPAHPLWAAVAARSARTRRRADRVRLRQVAPDQYVCVVTGPIVLSLTARGFPGAGGCAFTGLVHGYDAAWVTTRRRARARAAV